MLLPGSPFDPATYSSQQYEAQALLIMSLLSSTDTASMYDSVNASTVSYMPKYWAPLVTATIEGMTYPTTPIGHADHMIGYDYYYCEQHSVYVSETLAHEHWDVICGSCHHHKDDQCSCCPQCDNSQDNCECCGNCGQAPSWCECCEYCGCSECECAVCRDCDNKTQYCSCNSGGNGHTFGNTKTAPWESRPDAPMERTLPTIADCDHDSIDPLQSAANFYLLDAIKGMVRLSDVQGIPEHFQGAFTARRFVQSDQTLSSLTISATRSYNEMVSRLAPSFLAYAISAVGGELRYHKAVSRTVLSTNRDRAWKAFVSLVEVKGPEVLFDADTLFREFGSCSYGGEKWGMAAKVVGQYLKGNMPDWLFVDRVFTLQHNGGCFLNKVDWRRKNPLKWGLGSMLDILNAHAGVCSLCGKRFGTCPHTGEDAHYARGVEITDWDLLLRAASPEVAHMFRMTERAIERIARRHGGLLSPIPKTRHYLDA